MQKNEARVTPWKFNIAPQNIPSKKERLVFILSSNHPFFMGYVKLREGNLMKRDSLHAKL